MGMTRVGRATAICMILVAAFTKLGPAQTLGGEATVEKTLPPTPCRIKVENPTCPNGQGIPTIVNGFCSNKAVCYDLNANEKIPAGYRAIKTHFYVAEGSGNKPYIHGPWRECTNSDGSCPLAACRWEGMTAGFGKIKNWSDNHSIAAKVVVDYGR